MAGGELTSPSREPELLTSSAPRPRPTLQAHDVAKKSVRTLPVLHRGCGVHRWMRKQAVQLMVKRVGGGGNAHERTRTSENELHAGIEACARISVSLLPDGSERA